MPQLISKDVGYFSPHLKPTWDAPTIEANTFDHIHRPNLPALSISARINYQNGNVALICTNLIAPSRSPEIFLLSEDDILIAEPLLDYGDVVTRGGVYQRFDTLLWGGVTIETHRFSTKLQGFWRVLVSGADTGKDIWQSSGGCFAADGLRFRSLYQAANSIAEPLMVPLVGLPF
jgi:hypothetical protein